MRAKKQLRADELDRQIRAAERKTFAHYGAEPSENVIAVNTGVGHTHVRLSIFGPEESPETPVLLLHGIASLTILAAPLLKYVPNRRIIAVDWPGHGLSGPGVLPKHTDVRRHAVMTIRSILDALDLDEVDVIGHSMGGQFGLYASLELRDRVRRLVLLGAPGAGFFGVKPVPVMQLLAIPRLGKRLLSMPVSDKAFDKNNDLMLGAGALDRVPRVFLYTAKLAGGRKRNAASIASFFRALIKRRKVRHGVAVPLEELASLTQPTLLCWGDEDVFLSPITANASIISIPDHLLIRVAGAGHAPWLQAEELVGQAVANHLT